MTSKPRLRPPRHLFYILDENRHPVPIEEGDYVRWGTFFEKHGQLFHTETEHHLISTIFLGIDTAWSGPPRVFETMAFTSAGKPVDQVRYTSWEDAEAGHAAMVQRITKEEERARSR